MTSASLASLSQTLVLSVARFTSLSDVGRFASANKMLRKLCSLATEDGKQPSLLISTLREFKLGACSLDGSKLAMLLTRMSNLNALSLANLSAEQATAVVAALPRLPPHLRDVKIHSSQGHLPEAQLDALMKRCGKLKSLQLLLPAALPSESDAEEDRKSVV